MPTTGLRVRDLVPSRRGFLAALGVALARPGRAGAGAQGGGAAEFLRTMRRFAEGVRFSDLATGRAVAAASEPIARYNDPPRGIHDATLWAWSAAPGGRPLAALKVECYPAQIPERRWVVGLVSLAPGRVGAKFWDGTAWEAQAPGFEARAVPGAPAPAGTEGPRLAQARALARRFAATEFDGPARGRMALRLLSRPLRRYADPPAGLRDAALFAFAFGTNPEVLLALEARDRPGPPAWHYGVARLGGAEGLVELDGRGVWTVPYVSLPARRETYMNRWVAEDGVPS